jgi:crossover junction endodeoxyribonuclease RusA
MFMRYVRQGESHMPQRRQTAGTATGLYLTLPLPPSINEQYYTDSQGHRRLTPPALRYREDVRKILLSLERRGTVHPSFRQRIGSCYLALYLECYFETPLKRDLDNILKIVLDTLCHYFDANDNHVVDIHLSKRIRPLDPHIYLEIDTLDDWSFDEEYAVHPRA